MGLVSPRFTELAVVIRSLEVAPDGRAALGVGGGIVADSTPAEEWAEVLAKAAPLLSALGVEPPTPSARTAGSKGLADPAAGLSDTVLVVDGRAVEAAGHTARLRRSYWEVYRQALRADVETALAERAAALGPGIWRVRLRVTPEEPAHVTVESARWRRPRPVDQQPGLVLATRPAPAAGLERHAYADRSWLAAQAAQAGVRACAGARTDAGASAQAGLSPTAVTRVERAAAGGPTAGSDGADDVAFVAPDTGALLETTRSCLLAVIDGRLVTAPTDGQILPGVTRQVLVDLALDGGVAVELAAPTPAVLRGAEGLLAANALRGVEWVRSVGTATWPSPTRSPGD